MAKRFRTAPVPSGEVSSYVSDPYNLSSIYMFGSSSPFTGQGNTLVRPSDDLLISKGGNRALVVYQRLLYDEQVQACFRKLMQEITSRPWYVQQYSDKPGDLAVRDFVAEVLEEINIDDIYAGMAEAAITGFSVGEVMWKKTKRGVIPFDVRMRDQRRFVFQEQEDAQTGFVMRCLTFNRMFEGVELPERKFIVSRYFVSHNGDPYGAALGRILYPLVKFRRRAIESYVLYGDRYATPTAVAKAPLSASTRELDTLYGHLSNLSQETAMILPEGYELEFLNPSGSPDVFKNLIDYIDREISLVICGENEAGQAEAGSRASSQVANTVRVVRASELSEMLSKTLTQTLIRWIVDLNFGTDVAAPYLTREFRIEESTLTMPDVALMIQSGYTPRKEWIERHFRVELQQKDADTIPLADATPPDQAEDTAPEEEGGGEEEMDEDMLKSIFGDDWNVPEEDEEGSTEEEPAAKEDEEVAEEEPAKGEAPAEKKPTKKAPVEEKSPAEVPTKKATEPKKEKAPAEPPVKKAPVKNEAPKETDMVLVDSDGNVVPEGEYVTDEEGNFMDTQGNPLTPVQKPSKAKKPFGKEKITEDEAVEESKGK